MSPARPPMHRKVQPATVTFEPPLTVTAVARLNVKINPRSVTWETSFMTTRSRSTDTSTPAAPPSAGGQKYNIPVLRSKYHSPG